MASILLRSLYKKIKHDSSLCKNRSPMNKELHFMLYFFGNNSPLYLLYKSNIILAHPGMKQLCFEIVKYTVKLN